MRCDTILVMAIQSRNLLDDDETPEDLDEITISQIAGATVSDTPSGGHRRRKFH